MDIASGHFAPALQSAGNGRHELGPEALDVLARSRLFAGVAPRRLHERLRMNGEINLRAGAALLEFGQRHAAIYLLVSGRLAIFLDEDARIPIAHLGPGECIGESALIDDEATSACVMAVETSRLLVTTKADLWALMREEHRIALNLMEILAERVHSNNTSVLESFRREAKPSLISSIDPLTGLHNRRWLTDMFLRQIDRCARAGHPACMAMIDLDHFRSVNDTFGRQAGDLVLGQVARVMQKQFRPGDLLVRYGGEEFAVLLPATKLQAAVAALERLRLAVEATQTSVAQRTTVKVQISAGIAAWRAAWSLDDLIHNAERALTRAKSSGRNCVMVAESD